MKPIVTKNYLQIILSSSIQRVLEVFYKSPDLEFTLSDLAKKANVAKPHVGKILLHLQKNDLILIEKLPNHWRIKANTQSWHFLKSKIVYNLNFIYQSGIVEYLNEKYSNPKCIILFGSFRKGEDISTSDIDIALEIPDTKEYGIFRSKDFAEFEKTIGRKIQLHVFSKETVDINIFNSIANGVVLLGFLEVNL